MRSLCTRLATLAVAMVGFVVCSPGTARAEVGGVHLNLTPYAGFVVFDDGVNLQDKLIYGGRIGIGFGKTFGIEGSFGKSSTDTKTTLGGRPYVPEPLPIFNPLSPSNYEATFQHIALDLNLNLMPSAVINPYLLGGYSSHKIAIDSATVNNEETYGGFNVGGGLKLAFSPRVALRIEARDMIWTFKDEEEEIGAPNKSQHNIAYTGGLQLTLGGTDTSVDTDGDGVNDDDDECPNTPAGCLVDSRGCPLDADGDGVCDGLDTCPNTPSGATVDAKGCPMDSDGDGVSDGTDQCPNTPAGCTVDANGCPVDSDRDGVCDGLDTCANTPAGCRVDEKGCPTDSDGDGVCDGADQCPNTPTGARVDKDGCPIEISEREVELLEKGSITARDIYFDTAKSTIKPESEKTLQDLCTIFQQWPTLQIEVGGHADARGSDEYNMTLSDQRAAAVLEWMRTNCPNANLANFTSKGYGESTPVASNKTARGMTLNRRVEFKVMNPEELRRIKERRETLMKESGTGN
ncbi:MAG: OmpA family protein [Candidatus Eisenbacteria bacterium]